jgi:hypothetical protein
LLHNCGLALVRTFCTAVGVDYTAISMLSYLYSLHGSLVALQDPTSIKKCLLGVYVSLTFGALSYPCGKSLQRWLSSPVLVAKGRICIPQGAIIDLNILLLQLNADKFSPLWIQLIGTLVKRDPTTKALLDASYAGIGSCTSWPFSLCMITLEHPGSTWCIP